MTVYQWIMAGCACGSLIVGVLTLIFFCKKK